MNDLQSENERLRALTKEFAEAIVKNEVAYDDDGPYCWFCSSIGSHKPDCPVLKARAFLELKEVEDA